MLFPTRSQTSSSVMHFTVKPRMWRAVSVGLRSPATVQKRVNTGLILPAAWSGAARVNADIDTEASTKPWAVEPRAGVMRSAYADDWFLCGERPRHPSSRQSRHTGLGRGQARLGKVLFGRWPVTRRGVDVALALHVEAHHPGAKWRWRRRLTPGEDRSREPGAGAWRWPR